MRESKGAIRSGISIADDVIKFVEIERAAINQARITRIFQTNLDSPLNAFTIQNDSTVRYIGEQIGDIMQSLKFRLSKVIFTLESPFALIKKVVIDRELEDEDVIDQVDWEVKQFSYSTEDEYIVDFDRYERFHPAGLQELVIVSVREKIVQQIKKLFQAARLPVQVIDLDIFAAIRAIEFNYGLRAGEDIAIVDVGNQVLKFTLLKDREFFDYREIFPSAISQEMSSFGAFDDNNLFNVISTELKKFILNSNFSSQIESVNRIFLHGNMMRGNILEMLRNNYDVRIDILNPFREIKMAQAVTVDEKISAHPESFAVCIGSALRTKD